jgi:hypothetical protein
VNAFIPVINQWANQPLPNKGADFHQKINNKAQNLKNGNEQLMIRLR